MELKVIQHNTQRKKEALAAILQQGFEEKADIILIQEPPIWKKLQTNERFFWFSLTHPSFYTFLPYPSTDPPITRPRVIAFFRKLSNLNISPVFTITDPD
jgi:hypothetical protein